MLTCGMRAFVTAHQLPHVLERWMIVTVRAERVALPKDNAIMIPSDKSIHFIKQNFCEFTLRKLVNQNVIKWQKFTHERDHMTDSWPIRAGQTRSKITNTNIKSKSMNI